MSKREVNGAADQLAKAARELVAPEHNTVYFDSSRLLTVSDPLIGSG